MLKSSKSSGNANESSPSTKPDKKSKKNKKSSKLESSASSSAIPEVVGSVEGTPELGNNNGSVVPPVESAKEAKEKKDSWVKTIGMRTLRLRRSTDSRSSRLSIPSFSSLDRPGKSKKNKGTADSNNKPSEESSTNASATGEPEADSKRLSLGKSESIINGEHVKSPHTEITGASSYNGHTSKDVTGSAGMNTTTTQSSSAATSEPNNKVSGGTGETSDKQDPSRFLGDGLTFKGKLIGVLEVSGPRGDRICQEALSELKIAVKAAGEHKQKITIHIALDGLRIRDEKTGDCLYHHQVHKISFIAQDLTDTRAFGYIFGSPDTGHRFFGIKTEKSASQVVIAMRDLFQVVFDLKKKEIERAKQQLEMQQKFLATRAAETAPPSRPEAKFSIAETYIEGACAMGANTVPPNRTAPEVDLLNLEVELTSLQEGLDSIHHNLAESSNVPFRGSTASISSDPMNPMPTKRSSISSSTNNTTPVPNAFFANTTNTTTTSSSDPFGDSFDPYFDSTGQPTTTNANPSGSFKRIGSLNASSCSNSALTSPFSADPFANVDPFPDSKFSGAGGSDFFASDPFESPSGPFSFNFPSTSSEVTHSANASNNVSSTIAPTNQVKQSESGLNTSSGFVKSGSPAPAANLNHSSELSSTSRREHRKISDGWTASFEDNFVPDADASSGPTSGFSIDGKTEVDIFTELDPLGTGRTRPFVDRKDFFNDLKNPPKKGMNESEGSSLPSLTSVLKNDSSSLHPENSSTAQGGSADASSAIPNSFSSNFNPPSTGAGGNHSGIDFDSNFKSAAFSFNTRSESPPNYSPPPPPRTNMLGIAGDSGVTILPPPSSGSTNSPSASMRLMSKKSPQILKQMTIADSNASPKTLPRSSGRFSRQFTLDSSLKDDIPSLSPPPRPPHSTTNSSITSPGTNTTGRAAAKLPAAVPRPSSGSSSGGDHLRSISSTGVVTGIPPEPPPRPLQTTSSMMSSPSSGLNQMQVTSPPPLPPKKQNMNSLLSNPLGSYKPPYNIDSRSLASNNASVSGRNSHSEANDLPLPIPLRKTHTNTLREQQSSNTFIDSFQTSGGRYSVPLNNSQPNSLTLSGGSPSLINRRDNLSTKSNSSVDSFNSREGAVKKLSMEQALSQVASLSLGDLAKRLELPVDRLSSLTIQQLAEKLTEMDFKSKQATVQMQRSDKDNFNVIFRNKPPSSNSSCRSDRSESNNFGGFEDDFSFASAPAVPTASSTQRERDNYDRYAVFRDLNLEDASGFSIFGPNDSNSEKIPSSMMCNMGNNSEEDEDLSRTQEKTLTSRDSSSERTLQADDIVIGGGSHSHHNRREVSVASAIGLANTMDDVTDVNLSDDQDDNGKFPEDEDDLAAGFMNKPEWATFESNFDDQFCTTALVKAEIGNESPSWDSENENGDKLSTPRVEESDKKPSFEFKPYEKPVVDNFESSHSQLRHEEGPHSLLPEERHLEKQSSREKYLRNELSSPERIKSPPEGQFRRQSSGSSRHSERSSGGGNNGAGKTVRTPDFSDSGRPAGVSHVKGRKGSRDYERWDDREGMDRDQHDSSSRRYSGRDRDRDYSGRPDSRTSYSSIPRRYHSRDSDEEYGNGALRRTSGGGGNKPPRVGSGRRDREYERDRGEGVGAIEDEDDDRSHASYHSNYSSGGGPRRHHRRYPPKHYHSSGRSGRKGGGISPERYSNHESDDESCEDENGSYSRRDKKDRDRDYYAREKEYYDRYHRHRPSSSSGGYHQGGSKRHSQRDSPRHSDPYYRRDPRRGRHSTRKDDEVDDNSRDYSDYSGEEEYYGHHHGHHGSHRRIRSKRTHYNKERDSQRETRGHYYTNSPSWDSESGPEVPGEVGSGDRGGDRGDNIKSSSRPNSSKYHHDDRRRGGSPDMPGKYGDNSMRRDSGSNQRRYQSELALNSSPGNANKRGMTGNNESSHKKLSAFYFTEDFEGSNFSPDNGQQPQSLQNSDQLSSLSPTHENKVVPAQSKGSRNQNAEDMKISSLSGQMSSTDNNGGDLLGGPASLNEQQRSIDSFNPAQSASPFEDDFVARTSTEIENNGDSHNKDQTMSNSNNSAWDGNGKSNLSGDDLGFVMGRNGHQESLEGNGKTTEKGESRPTDNAAFPEAFEEDDGEDKTNSTNGAVDEFGNSSADVFPPANDPKVFPYSGRRLESIKSEEEKSNDDSHSASESAVQMKKSDSFNIFKHRADDPFADDDFFA